MWILRKQGGIFQVKFKFPNNYPYSPPEMVFVTPMWHPNIYPDGRVCISILHQPGEDEFNPMEKASERWNPVLGVKEILLSVISMLNDPNKERKEGTHGEITRKRLGFNKMGKN